MSSLVSIELAVHIFWSQKHKHIVLWPIEWHWWMKCHTVDVYMILVHQILAFDQNENVIMINNWCGELFFSYLMNIFVFFESFKVFGSAQFSYADLGVNELIFWNFLNFLFLLDMNNANNVINNHVKYRRLWSQHFINNCLKTIFN